MKRDKSTQSNFEALDQEEIEYIIEYQIELKKHIDSQASKLLGIWLTFVGIFLTLGISFGSGQLNFPQHESPLSSSQIEMIEGSVPFLTEEWAELMVFSTTLFGIVTILATIIYLFIISPRAALNTLQIETPSPYTMISEYQSKKSESPQEVFERNQRIMTNAKGSWQKCLLSIERGLYALGFSVISLILLFVYLHPFFLIFFFIAIIILALHSLDTQFDTIRSKIVIGTILDNIHIGLILATALTLSGLFNAILQNLIFLFIYFTGSVLFIYSMLQVKWNVLYQYTIRSGTVFVVSVVLLVIFIGRFYPYQESSTTIIFIELLLLSVAIPSFVLFFYSLSLTCGLITARLNESDKKFGSVYQWLRKKFSN